MNVWARGERLERDLTSTLPSDSGWPRDIEGERKKERKDFKDSRQESKKYDILFLLTSKFNAIYAAIPICSNVQHDIHAAIKIWLSYVSRGRGRFISSRRLPECRNKFIRNLTSNSLFSVATKFQFIYQIEKIHFGVSSKDSKAGQFYSKKGSIMNCVLLVCP